MLSIDGVQWPLQCEVTRAAELTASEISGLMLDKSYFNDVIGTWMTYDVKIVVPFGMETEYAQIYERLTDPVDGHLFVLPYNNSTIQITGRVTQVRDRYYPRAGGSNYWAGTEFSVVANHPTKTYTLSQMIARGRAGLPDVASGTIGETYVYTASGWEKVVYGDGDNTYY